MWPIQTSEKEVDEIILTYMERQHKLDSTVCISVIHVMHLKTCQCNFSVIQYSYLNVQL